MRYQIPFDGRSRPTLMGGLDLATRPLHPFEAYVVSFVDGRSTVRQLSQSARLSDIEVCVVLKALVERGVVVVTPPPSPFDDEPDTEVVRPRARVLKGALPATAPSPSPRPGVGG